MNGEELRMVGNFAKRVRVIVGTLQYSILILVAVLMIFFTWGPFFYPFFFTIYYNVTAPQNNSFGVPMRTVGVNYPTISIMWLGVSFIIFVLILFLMAKRRKASSGLFWINGISISIILSHIIMWIYLINPFQLIT